MARMTLSEKLGQLTMTAAGYTVTGPVIAGDSTQAIIDGTIGNLLNLVGAGPAHEMQRLAVEKSRLRIPLLIGLDIIHGHRTLFPIPLAEAGIFDETLWERTAREAAREGAADGLHDDFRADARRVARSPLGPHRGRPRRRPLAQRAHRAGQGARFPGDRSVVGRIAGRLCEAFRRVRRGHRGAGVRRRGHLRARLARSASAGLRSGGPRRRRDADAVLHRSQRRADDGAHPLAARLAARRDGLGRRHRQRLQRDRGVDQAWGRRRSRRCRGAGAEGRRRHRHDGRRVSQGPADRARAGTGDDRRDRRVRAPRVAAQGATRSVRRPLPPRRDTGARGGRRRAARAGARRRAQGRRHAEERARHPALACGGEGAVCHRPAGRRKHRDERPVVECRRTRAGRQRACRPARRAAADRNTPCTRRRHRGRRRQRHRSRRPAVRWRRRRPAVPGRACHDERRGGEPRHARASRASSRLWPKR